MVMKRLWLSFLSTLNLLEQQVTKQHQQWKSQNSKVVSMVTKQLWLNSLSTLNLLEQ